MRFLSIGFMFLGLSVHGEDLVIRMRPANSLSIKCVQGETLREVIEGPTASLSIQRVSSTSEIRYEIYRDGYLVATCDNIVIK